MKYQIATFREAGLEAKWSKVGFKPIIIVKYPKAENKHQREKWWVVDGKMFEYMKGQGIIEGFLDYTLLGDIFYV